MIKLDLRSLFYTGSGTMSPTFVSIAGPAAEGAIDNQEKVSDHPQAPINRRNSL